MNNELQMAGNKRITIATICGLVSGIGCYLGGRYIVGIDMEGFGILILLHRMLLGFVIGISSLKWHWALHGTLLGLIFGIADFHFILILQGNFSSGLYLMFGPIWGLLIEFLTTVVFKAGRISRNS